MQHCLNHSIMVLAFKDNHQLAVTVPAGKTIQVIGPVDDDNRFLVVDVDDEQFHIFASDLEDRAEQVLAHQTAGLHSEEGTNYHGLDLRLTT